MKADPGGSSFLDAGAISLFTMSLEFPSQRLPYTTRQNVTFDSMNDGVVSSINFERSEERSESLNGFFDFFSRSFLPVS